MESPIANSFVHAFKPMERMHVLWLRRMNRMMDKLDPAMQMNLVEMINENPMGVKLSNGVDWVFVHFSLAMVYSKAVLDGKAWVPTN
jgi:hypothetical protein